MTKFQNIYLINFLLFTHIQSFFYLSIDIYGVDECVNKIEVDNEIHFNRTSNCTLDLNIYSNDGKPIIENVIYKLGKTIIIQIYNKSKMISKCYINMKVKINEYFIGLSNNNNIWNL